MPIKKNSPKEAEDTHAKAGVNEQAERLCLTQAGGSVTRFVKLVKQSSRENRKVSGLAIR